MKRTSAVLLLLWCIIWPGLVVWGSGTANNPGSPVSIQSQGADPTGNGGYPIAVVNAAGTSLDVATTPAASVLLGSHTFVGGADVFSVSVDNVTEVAVHISGTLTTGDFFVGADNTTLFAGPQAYSVQEVTPGWTSVNNVYFVSPDTWIVPVSGFSTLYLQTDGGFTGNLVVSVNTVTAPSWFNIANEIIVQSGAAHIGAGFGDNESNAANVPINNLYNAVGSQCFPFVYNRGTGKWDRESSGTPLGSVLVDGSAVTQPVSGTFFQATQPVSGTVAATQSGTWTVQPGNTANTTAWKVDGSAVTQPVSVAATVTVSKDLTTGRTVVMKTGSLTTTAATADQVVLTYTVTGGKTFYLEYLTLSARPTTLAIGGSILGTASLEAPSGTKDITDTLTNPTTEEVERILVPFSEPLPFAAGSVVRVVCTPTSTTSMLWTANFGGYEK